MIFPLRSRKFREDNGFTLIEILLTMSLVGILSAVGIAMMTSSVDEGRYDATVEEMRQIRVALVGDTEARQGGSRSSFGYLGDMGSLPTASQGLGALLSAPSGSTAWSVNSAVRFGLGWNGPYLSSSVSGQDALRDAWGRSYVYTPGPPATITSLGADGSAGGTGFNQDIVITLPNELRFANVYGFVSTAGGPYNGAAQVEISYPNGNGSVVTTLVSIAAGSQGAFQFNAIPLGYRSLSIYMPSKADRKSVV